MKQPHIPPRFASTTPKPLFLTIEHRCNSTMASQFLRSACRPLLFAVPLCASYSVLQTRISSPIRCDYASGPLHPSVSEFTLKHGGPSSQQKTLFGGLITAETARQISLGSALGVLTGLGLRIFLRTLAFSIGLAIIIIEVCFTRSCFNNVRPGCC